MKKRRVTEAESPILANVEVAPGIFLLRLTGRDIAEIACPGQFLHMRIQDSFDPFLRRPFSIHRVLRKTGEIQVLYRAAGRGTEVLSCKRPGEHVNCIGPLGNGFDPVENERSALIVAGGMGIAPLIFLVEELLQELSEVVFLIGAASQFHVLYEKELREWGVCVEVATDDGSLGHHGRVTDLVVRHLKRSSNIPIFACGPEPMCERVADIAIQYNVPCQLSLENWMGCGMGACLGCVVPVRSEGAPQYKRVCRDGPVFEAGEVRFDWGVREQIRNPKSEVRNP